MFKKLNFRKKLFIYLSIIFVVFAILVLLIQYDREKDFRKRQLENTLNNVTEFTHKYIKQKHLFDNSDYRSLDSIASILPGDNIRITLIDPSGSVLYDSEVSNYELMENHLNRLEIQSSISANFGANIRKSSTTNNSYYYYAKSYPNYYIRAAVLYDIKIKNFLIAEKVFISYLLLLFFVIWIILLFVTKRLGETITKLKDFSISLSTKKQFDESIVFPDDELGIISSQITNVYKKLNIAKEEILIEKNKLHSHLQALNEGIAFFSKNKEKVLTNNHFIQFLNLIADQSTISAEKIFEVPQFKQINKFINNQLNNFSPINSEPLPQIEIDFYKDERYFNIRCIIFQDKSFEIVIKETTKYEKRRVLKQQMTSNIAHELKTPLATVLGYLETLQQNNLAQEKQIYFTEKAYVQAKRLSSLIEDISMLNKIEETKEYFEFEEVNIKSIILEVDENLKMRLDELHINVNINMEENVMIRGNKSLLFSVFYNLFDNAIKYGGENISINVSNYLDDDEFYYFSFSNTGSEIDKIHFPRIFERFYRLDIGRSRKTGGTGLGLAIVKNAIKLHHGNIKAKSLKEGGVEFLFSIAK